MKTIVTVLAAAAVITLVGVLACRLGSCALVIIVGVILGRAALIPTLVMVGILLRRSQSEADTQPTYQPQPPVIVVSGGGYQMPMQPQQTALPDPTQALIPPPPPQPQRKFRMMGHESTETVDINENEWASY